MKQITLEKITAQNSANQSKEAANGFQKYAELTYESSKGRQVRIINLDTYDGVPRLSNAFGGFKRLNNPCGISIKLFYNGEEVGHVTSRKDEYDERATNYWLQLNANPDKEYCIGRVDYFNDSYGIWETMLRNQIYPRFEVEDKYYREHVERLVEMRSEAAEIVNKWDSFDNGSLEKMPYQDIYDKIIELAGDINQVSDCNCDSYKMRKLLFEMLSFADNRGENTCMIEWLGEEGEIRIRVECGDILTESFDVSIEFYNDDLSYALGDVCFCEDEIEELPYMVFDILDEIQTNLGVSDGTEENVA